MKPSAIESLGSLIVGCWQFDDRSWKLLPSDKISHALDTYLALGLNAFDTADIYGRSERVLGEFLPKRDCMILTKAVFFGEIPSAAHIRHKVENSLRNLHREFLDCVQVHWHHPHLNFSSCFEILQDLVDEGKIRSLGVTNFNTPMLEKALQLAPIQSHQVQYSLIDRRVEASMQDLCLKHKISLLAYGALAGGFLSSKYLTVPTLKGEANHSRGFYYSSMIKVHGGWLPVRELLQVLKEMAQKYEKTIAQVALNWVKQQPGVKAVLCGFTYDRQQIEQTATALTWTLLPEDLQLLSDCSSQLFEQRGDIYSYER